MLTSSPFSRRWVLGSAGSVPSMRCRVSALTDLMTRDQINEAESIARNTQPRKPQSWLVNAINRAVPDAVPTSVNGMDRPCSETHPELLGRRQQKEHEPWPAS